MGWEKRERGGVYYTRSMRGRPGGQAVPRRGNQGKIVALEDDYQRRRREKEAAYWKEEKERLKQGAAILKEPEEAAKILATARSWVLSVPAGVG